MPNKIDQTIFAASQTKADQLQGIYGARDEQFETYEKIYLLNWDDAPSADGFLKTASPDGRNKVLGAKRLLVSTDPIPKVETENSDIEKSKADEIEKACKRILYQSGRSFRMPLHYAAVESALIYGEVHIAISDTASMAALASKSNKARADKLALTTPFLCEVWNPHYGYPQFDAYGLCGYLRRVMVAVGELGARFGQAGEDYALGKNPNALEELDIFYDVENYAVWVGGVPLLAYPHDLPFIPISCTLVDGSNLWTKPEDQRQPLLYGLAKSDMWKRQNLALSVMYTNLFNIGINPTFIHTAPPGNPTKQVNFDASTAGGVIDLEAGETFGAMATKGILDPSFNQALEIAERKGEESTMYSQALGQSMGGGVAYSTVSLMSQSGRLPLIITQKMCEAAIGSALEMCMAWYKKNGSALKTFVKPSDVPDTIQITAKLDIDLPQDKLQMVSVASMLKKDGIVDNEWIRRNILNIENNTQSDEDTASDRFFEAMVIADIQALVPQMIKSLTPPEQPVNAPIQAGASVQPGMPSPTAPEQPQPGQPGQPDNSMNPAMGGIPSVQAGQLPMQGPIDQGGGQGMPPGMGG